MNKWKVIAVVAIAVLGFLLAVYPFNGRGHGSPASPSEIFTNQTTTR